MILSSFLAALGQLSDRRFLRVAALGIALSLALLVGFSAGAVWLIAGASPESLTLPLVGEVRWVGDLLGWGAALLMAGLSVFLMVPVASAFSGLFLEDIADAVEARHYPALPPVARLPLWETFVGSVNFLGVVIAVNLLALVFYVFTGPLIPVVFWALNGYLLGREYFEMAATRRLGRAGAKALRKRNAGKVWLAGTLMAAPLSLPLVNLLIPALGAATFTHLFHRMAARAG